MAEPPLPNVTKMRRGEGKKLKLTKLDSKIL